MRSFSSNDDLKRAGHYPLRRLLVAQQKAVPTATFVFRVTIFDHARGHLSHDQALAGGRASAVAFTTIREILSDLVRRELAATDDDGAAHAVARAVTVQFVVTAYMTVLAWWLNDSAKLSPKTIDAMFRRLAISGAGTSADVKKPVSE